MTGTRPSLREVATEVVRQLQDAGFEAYFAGGCVRDHVMGFDPTDYDVATDARPDDLAELFRRSRSVGESFGVVLVRNSGHVIEVATFRTDGVYSDGRRPDEVVFSDAEHDATRRDFTINGLFEDPLGDRIIDFVGGRADIDAGVVRAIGDPDARFREDRLRRLRAVRFAAKLGFEIDEATAVAIRDGEGGLDGVSRERVGHEIRRMLGHAARAEAARLLQSLRLDEMSLDEPSADVPLPALAALDADADIAVALAAWMLDRHGPDVGPDVPARWTNALMLSNKEAREVMAVLRSSQAVRDWAGRSVAQRKRAAASLGFEPALTVVSATEPDLAAAVRTDVQELSRTELAPAPLAGGHDLIEAGLKPGPTFSRLLEQVYDAQLEGRIASLEEAIALARQLAGRDQ